MTTPDRPAIIDAPERRRYEATVGDQLAGILEYVIKHGRIALIHSEVSPAHRGRGVAAALARFALDDARRRELKVIVNCPYVQDYVRRHPDDDDIIIGRAGTTPT